MPGAGVGRLRRLAVFDAAFIPQVASLLRLLLALGGLAVFVGLFLHEAGCFFGLTFDAHVHAPAAAIDLIAVPTSAGAKRSLNRRVEADARTPAPGSRTATIAEVSGWGTRI